MPYHVCVLRLFYVLLFCAEEGAGETDLTACLPACVRALFLCVLCFLLWNGCRSTQLMPTTADDMRT